MSKINYDLFGYKIDNSEQIKQKNQKRAAKAALTKKINKEKQNKEFERNFIIARSYGDLFLGNFSEDERIKAEMYIQKNKKEKK